MLVDAAAAAVCAALVGRIRDEVEDDFGRVGEDGFGSDAEFAHDGSGSIM